jgi:hypothetical protein
MGYTATLNLVPGTYPLSVEQDVITFQIGKKRYSIYKDYLMNHGDAPINCFKACSGNSKVYPLKQNPSNRFFLGIHSEFEIVVHFNHVEILKNQLDGIILKNA